MTEIPKPDYRLKPHLYFWQSRWWVTLNSRNLWRLKPCGLTLNDTDNESFAAACRWARFLTMKAGVAE